MTTEERRRIIADALHGARPEPVRPEPEPPLQAPLQPTLTPGYSYWGYTGNTLTPVFNIGNYGSATISFPTSNYTQF